MITVPEIIGTTALRFGVDLHSIYADVRDQHTVNARHTAMYVARKVTLLSLPDIGRVFGRDHSTVKHAIERIESEMKSDERLRSAVSSLLDTARFCAGIEAHGCVDVLAIARQIASDPSRRSIAASTIQIAALAATVLDLWEIALAADRIGQLIAARTRSPGDAAPIDAEIQALAAAIASELAAMSKQEKSDGEVEG